jgi:hypothetical protein
MVTQLQCLHAGYYYLIVLTGHISNDGLTRKVESMSNAGNQSGDATNLPASCKRQGLRMVDEQLLNPASF